MARKDSGDFSSKHGPGATPDPDVAGAVREAAGPGGIPCAQVFRIASEHGISPEEAGRTVDLLNIKLMGCQLGLFGHPPGGSPLKPAETVSPGLESAIREGLVEGRLPCARAWEIAERFQLKKIEVARAAEALGIKIKPCQLGAF